MVFHVLGFIAPQKEPPLSDCPVEVEGNKNQPPIRLLEWKANFDRLQPIHVAYGSIARFDGKFESLLVLFRRHQIED